MRIRCPDVTVATIHCRRLSGSREQAVLVDHFLCDGLEERGEGHQLDCNWIQRHEVQDYIYIYPSQLEFRYRGKLLCGKTIYTSGHLWVENCEDRALVLEFLPACMANAKTNSLVGLTILLEVLGAWLDRFDPFWTYIAVWANCI
jgi:hypothetical protein